MWLVQNGNRSVENVKMMEKYCRENRCRRKVLLKYFGEESQGCGLVKCDNCMENRLEI